MIILIPALVGLLGLIVYFATKTNAEVKEAGKIAFFWGLGVTLIMFASHYAKLF